MQKFMIEVAHEASESACHRAIKILHETGSHYLTNADFGCTDGAHKAWIIVEVENKEQARNILPAVYRESAKITKLVKFSREEVEKLLEHHES